MDPQVQRDLSSIKDDPALPINLKWAKLKEVLLQKGLAWVATLPPSQILVHPSNRGGIMLNSWDVHSKGATILQLGASLSKIQESVAIEMSHNPAKQQDQVAANTRLVASSHGTLAAPNGKERYLSVSSSHLTAFCRAVTAGCQTQEPTLAQTNQGVLGMDTLSTVSSSAAVSNPFVEMCSPGWPWIVVSHLVEENITASFKHKSSSSSCPGGM